ncbi:MAG: hypothetical protein HKO95_12725 [Rhodobacteraceae bacterium]|nr:hypothetical protein [Paracoccaceae bacterium]
MRQPAPMDARDFKDQPWQWVEDEDLGPALAVPTMLSKQERRLYLWLAEDWAVGAGAIVDLGCFAGGSTAPLAEGCRRAGRTQPIHAYDRFRASENVKAAVLYSAGIAPFEGKDILPLTQRLLAPWEAEITLHPGDIKDQDWPSDPIEVLCVDAAKTAETADSIAAKYFPALIPGRSVVVQQDFLHWKVPWIPAQMERLADFFSPVATCPRDTVVYLCTRTPTREAVEEARLTGLRDRDLQDLLARARVRLRDFGVEDRLLRTAQALIRNPNMRRAKDFTNRP